MEFEGSAHDAAYTAWQKEAIALGDLLVTNGRASFTEVAPLLDWATHPDCSPAEGQQIVETLWSRLDYMRPAAQEIV